jgi:hypothetical protein
MTKAQAKRVNQLIEDGYTYYSSIRGDIILTRPLGYNGPGSSRVKVDNNGTIIELTSKEIL